MSTDESSVQALAEDCIVENARFQREGQSDPKPCFELLRLALAESNEDALKHAYAIYKPKLEQWASLHHLFDQTREEAEFFADWAFVNFLKVSSGEAFLRKFNNLPSIIRYMQVCIHNTISDYMRKPPLTLLPDEFEAPYPTSLTAELDIEHLWAHICELLPNPTHQFLAHLVFILDMKPREIIQKYGHLWTDEHAISSTLYRIRLTLRNDQNLRDWFNEPGPSASG